MRTFLMSSAGKALICLLVTCITLIFPLVGAWLVAAFTLYHAVLHLREAFRQLDAEAETTPEESEPVASPVRVSPVRGESPNCNVDAVLAALAAQPAPAMRNHR